VTRTLIGPVKHWKKSLMISAILNKK